MAAKLFRPRRDLAFQTAKAILGASVGYSWCPAGCQGQFALLLCRFCSFLLINFLDLSSRIEAGEEICSNYLDDPETTYCARSLRQVSTNLRFGTLYSSATAYLEDWFQESLQKWGFRCTCPSCGLTGETSLYKNTKWTQKSTTPKINIMYHKHFP